jgi:hypothetical protein
MNGRPPRSKLLQEVIELVCLVVLLSGWAFVTLFPEAGLESIEEALVRGALLGAAAFLVALTLSCPLKSLGLIRWAPPLDLYRRYRERRRRRLDDRERARYERQHAPYRAIESLSR